jgi:hypothetical protein
MDGTAPGDAGYVSTGSLLSALISPTLFNRLYFKP